MAKITGMNHLAVVVNDVQAALGFWRDALGLPLAKLEHNEGEQVDIAFLPLSAGEIELIAPTDTGGGVAKYLAKRGAGMHHVCLEVDNIVEMMDQLRAKGIELINDAPKVNELGVKYCFIHPKSANGVMVELYELPQ